MKSGDLRQRVTFQRETEIKDPLTGMRKKVWLDLLLNEPAQYLAGPGREFMAGNALRDETSGRFVIRYSDAGRGLRASDRALWDGRVFDVKSAPMPDVTARQSLTIMVSEFL